MSRRRVLCRVSALAVPSGCSDWFVAPLRCPPVVVECSVYSAGYDSRQESVVSRPPSGGDPSAAASRNGGCDCCVARVPVHAVVVETAHGTLTPRSGALWRAEQHGSTCASYMLSKRLASAGHSFVSISQCEARVTVARAVSPRASCFCESSCLPRVSSLQVFRLVCVDERGRCCGVVSMRDITAFFVSLCDAASAAAAVAVSVAGAGGASAAAAADGGHPP